MQDIMKLLALLLAATSPSTAIKVKQDEAINADSVKDTWSKSDPCVSMCPPKCEACGALCDPESPTRDMSKCKTCLLAPECETCAQCQMERDIPELFPGSLEETEEDPAVADTWSKSDDCKSSCSPKCEACGALCDPESPTVDIAACRTCIEVPECWACAQCQKERDTPEKPASLEEAEEDPAVADSWSKSDDCKSSCSTKCEACGAFCDPESSTVDMAACRKCIEVPECWACAQCQKEQDTPETPASLEEGEEDPAVADSWSKSDDCKSSCSPKCEACGALCDPESPTVDMAACRKCIEVPECWACAQCQKERDTPETPASLEEFEEGKDGECTQECSDPKCEQCKPLCNPESATHDMSKCEACIVVPECEVCATCHAEKDVQGTIMKDTPEKPASFEQDEEVKDGECTQECSDPKCEQCKALCDPESSTHDMSKCEACIRVPECEVCATCHAMKDLKGTTIQK